MASCPISFPTTVNNRQQYRALPPNHNCTATETSSPIKYFPSSSSSTINLRRSFPSKRSSWSARRSAPTPPPEPPSNKNPPPSSGVTALFSRFQDRLQVFLGVLFWMSLFFWYCAWDGGNNGGPNKRSRF